MTAPPPIRIPCEGSEQPGFGGHFFGILCSMCGHIVHHHIDTNGDILAVPHDRDDIISMLQRGDFG